MYLSHSRYIFLTTTSDVHDSTELITSKFEKVNKKEFLLVVAIIKLYKYSNEEEFCIEMRVLKLKYMNIFMNMTL